MCSQCEIAATIRNDWFMLRQYLKDELPEALEGTTEDDYHDELHEFVDSLIPVYTADLLAMAATNINLAVVEPELGPAYDGKPTPVNVIAANLYELLMEEAEAELVLLREDNREKPSELRQT